jgi:hypothetical protein
VAQPVDFWRETQPLILRTIRTAIDDYGHKPEVLGKHRGFWNQMHQTIELHLLRGRGVSPAAGTAARATT